MKKFLIGKPKLTLTPLGGVDAVGERNCLLLRHGKDGVLLDCGQKIPVNALENSEDGIIPDEYNPDFSKLSRVNILGVIISHAHLDHIGGLKKFTGLYPDVPVITSRFTMDVIRGKLFREESGSFRWNEGDKISLGPFEIKRFPVLHSIPGSCAFLVSAGGRNVVYDGDIKTPGKHVPEQRQEKYDRYNSALAEIGELGVDVLIHDATNIKELGYAGIEEEVYPAIDRLTWINEGRIFIGLASSNAARLRNIVNIATRKGRKVYVAGPALREFLRIAELDGCTPFPHDERFLKSMPKDAVILATGHQGESKSFLQRLSRGELEFDCGISRQDALAVLGDTIPKPEVWSRSQKMLEELSSMFGRIFLTYDAPEIRSRGARITRGRNFHRSGHGKQDDTRDVLEVLQPKLLVPFHAELARREVMADFASTNFRIESVLLKEGEAVEL